MLIAKANKIIYLIRTPVNSNFSYFLSWRPEKYFTFYKHYYLSNSQLRILCVASIVNLYESGKGR